MVDVLVVLTVVAFFAVTVVYVRLCDRIVGPDPERAEADGADDGADDASAGAGGAGDTARPGAREVAA